MIFFRFSKIGPPYREMIKWCKDRAHKFTHNSMGLNTGVWLHEDDAIIFRLKFGIDYEVKSIDN